jgi:DNA polymerase-3 subunit delta
VGEHGKRISRDAILLLIERVGQTLSDIDNEISKLVSYIGAKPMIEANDIQEASGFTRQNNLHELNLALGRADAAAAIGLVDQVLDEGVRPIQLLAAMIWHFRNLLDLSRRLEAGENLADLATAVKNPQARREMQSQAKTYSPPALEKIFKELLDLDERLKTGKTHWELFLQLAIFRICTRYAHLKTG